MSPKNVLSTHLSLEFVKNSYMRLQNLKWIFRDKYKLASPTSFSSIFFKEAII